MSGRTQTAFPVLVRSDDSLATPPIERLEGELVQRPAGQVERRRKVAYYAGAVAVGATAGFALSRLRERRKKKR